jgi:predicted nucleotidyltransferase
MLSELLKSAIIEKIKSVSSPISIILFGSYVYGSPDQNSDIDILILEREVKSKIEEISKVTAALRDIPFPKDILVATLDEYEFYRKEPGSIFRTISEKGEVIFG